jgi:ribosomal protein S27E
MTIDEQKLDGNAAGGLLAQIFAVEMTTAQVTCAGCGNSLPMANTAVYATAMGTIIRCPGCDVALVRIVSAPQRYWIDVSGLRMIQLPVS